MMRRIGITQRVAAAGSYAERRDCLAQEWGPWLASRGIAAIPLPNTLPDPAAHVLALGVEGLIISGGNTVGLQGETDPPEDVKPERDGTERALLDFAAARRLPVLGVCRGLQMVNRHFGGTVTRALSRRPEVTQDHVAKVHSVQLCPEWAALAGTGTLDVNSFHDDGVLIADLAPSLEVLATSDGGAVIEALRHATLPIIAVQWHPERPGPSGAFDDDLLRRLFGLEGTA